MVESALPDAAFSADARQVLAANWPDADPTTLSFLASGEYTHNYRVTLDGGDAVLRVITGSQMGLTPPEQALYEAHALNLLADSAHTPHLIDLDPASRIMGHPYILLAYLPGRPLDYRRDLCRAARCIAAVHRQEVPNRHRLQIHADPVVSILDEAGRLLRDLPDSPVASLVGRLAHTHDSAYDALRSDQTIINTDLNSHNFIVDGDRVWLIDWEKARIGPSLMDIAHFLLPTTTLWRDRTAVRLTEPQQEAFVSAYLEERPELDPDAYRAALRPAMQLATVRALAWCAWAVAASQRGERAIVNEETLTKCRQFTDSDFLGDLETELWG